MRTITIPGGSAYLRELNEVSVRQRNMVRASFLVVAHLYTRIPQEILDASKKEGQEGVDARQKVNLMMISMGMTQEEAMALLSQQSSSIVAFLSGWTLTDESGRPRELPTLDSVLDLDPELYDVLAEEVAGPAAELLLGTVNMDPVPREVNPTAPFGGSETSSGPSSTPDTQTPKSTGKQRKGTESTATASSTV